MDEPQPAVVVVATAIEEEQEQEPSEDDARTPARPSSGRPRSSRTRTRRRRARPASAAAGERGSSTEREREQGRRRPSSATAVGSPDRSSQHSAETLDATPGETYNAWGTLENTLQSVQEGPDDDGVASPREPDTDEERSERRRSKRGQRGRSARSSRRRRDDDGNDGEAVRERRPRGAKRGKSARRKRAPDNLDDEAELLEEDSRRGSEEQRPATAGTMRVPHVPTDVRPSSGSVASFHSVSARPTSRPSEMVGMPPNMDGSTWVQPNRPASAHHVQTQQRQRSARRQNSARSTRSFEQREGKAEPEAVRVAEVVKAAPADWLAGEDDVKPKWWSRAKAVKVAGAAANNGKVRVEQRFNPDGSLQTKKETRKARKQDSVEVFVHEHQVELVEYFQSGHLQMALPLTASRVRAALGTRPGVRRLLALLCCATLALGVYMIYLTVQLGLAREELDELQLGGGGGGAGGDDQGGADATVRTYATAVVLSKQVIPYNQFARVCRCAHRPARSVATHITALEAHIEHIYGDAMAASEGRSQLVAGISLYDVSMPWSPTNPSSVGGGTGYCDADVGDANHDVNHDCEDQLGEGFGAGAKLLWQWSPFRAGEGIPGGDSTFFRFPTVS